MPARKAIRAATLLVLLLLLVCPTLGQSPRKWPFTRYAEVRAYLFNLESQGPSSVLLSDRKLNRSVENPEGVLLNKKQVDTLLEAVLRPRPVTVVTMCYAPRHAFVFYNAARKPVAWINLCFECENEDEYPGLPFEHVFDWPALSDLVTELGLPILPGPTAYREWKNKKK